VTIGNCDNGFRRLRVLNAAKPPPAEPELIIVARRRRGAGAAKVANLSI